ncbi:mandelate racemase/muconate lactonizing protein [Halorubrum saccharovorum DSM 1137]|uniref:o-succinylbenzoate synthase n=1 Tax=Halorubrum saccharovorum DSM 1137 TaxID=1227484 RepID=M0DNG3_9EURY|nr:o-succinylbenzoate synthase [Halorubrum saccharovorum]ELZ36257.1 mandelate racemase/muconate lactonizing protein [Halorubrum saccharovorum DSM 1137]
MQLRPFSLGLATPLRTARGSIDRREGFLVAVDPESDGESVPAPGLGEATPLPGWTESRSACEAALREVGDGNGGKEPATRALSRLDPTETPAARHGLALALADATARDADRSLSEHLARTEGLPAPAEAVPVNATIGDGDPGATVDAAETAVEAGFDCLKVKVGARGLDADVERLRAVRRAVGDDVSLRADANGAWDRETAREAVERLAPLGLAYLEQPLPADDLDGAAALRSAAADADSGPRVPIALDESLASRGLDAVLDAGAADAVVLKPMAIGGPDRTLAAARRARETGVEPVVTTTVDAVVARTAAVHVAAAIPDVAPCGLATGPLLDADLAPDPCPVSDGAAAVPSGPGLAGDAFDGLP